MAKKWVASVKGAEGETTVASDRSSGGWQLQFGDESVAVEAARMVDGSLSLLVGTRSYVINLASGSSETAWSALVGGANLEITIEDAARKSLATATGGGRQKSGETVFAPIAGKVVDVVVAVGETVKAGDRLVVLEAMKMENEIRASSDGEVRSVHVEVGQSVDTNQKLLMLK